MKVRLQSINLLNVTNVTTRPAKILFLNGTLLPSTSKTYLLQKLKEPQIMINHCILAYLQKKDLQKKKEALHPGWRKILSPLLPPVYTVNFARIKVNLRQHFMAICPLNTTLSFPIQDTGKITIVTSATRPSTTPITSRII